MPPDLPGLYYDVEKKRYFPLSKRPAGAAQSPAQTRALKRARGAHSSAESTPVIVSYDLVVQRMYDVRRAVQDLQGKPSSSLRRLNLQ
jgi:hypothetical protein